MDILSKHQIKHIITDRDTDFRRKLSLSALFSYFQDIASTHSGLLGAGVEYLKSELGIAWILMRMSVEVKRMPDLYEEITVETWPGEPKAIYDRSYTVTDKKGNTVIRAVSAWILMDLKKREIVKERVIDYSQVEIIKERALDYKPAKLKAGVSSVPIGEKAVVYSNIDYNRHLNNAKYMDIVMDCFDIDYLESHTINTVDINYVNEAHIGETVSLYKDLSGESEGSISVEGISGEKVVFRSRVGFK
jgi:acyl-ACP thioesterase